MSFLPHGAHDGPRTDRQEEILEQLSELFAREGFRSFTLGDIAARLSCSRRTLYEVAESKEDLVALVAGRFLDANFRHGVEATRTAGSARDRIHAFVEAVVTDAARMSLTFADDLFSTPRTAALVAHYDERCTSLAESLIRDGQASGEFAPINPAIAASSLMAAIERVQDTAVLTALGLQYAEATQQVLELVLTGLDQRR